MRKLRIHYLQHVHFEDLGCIEQWILEKGHTQTYTKFYTDFVLPNHSSYDWLIILGGPMGVYQQEKYSWLVKEKEFIKQAIEQNKTVIGICLGSQLIASALGANVFVNNEKEIGWFPINASENLTNPLFNNQKNYTVFHWHGDTFDLPQNAVLLASSNACTNQAFIYNNKVIGLQFHLEVTENSIQQMIEFGISELITPENYIQTEKEILNNKNYLNSNNQRMFQLLNYLEAKYN
ncbi:MAG: type 1 glutamine amidotransferase [Solirubrobacteraceae bacterium]